jgi:Tol biopolymer transport system component
MSPAPAVRALLSTVLLLTVVACSADHAANVPVFASPQPTFASPQPTMDDPSAPTSISPRSSVPESSAPNGPTGQAAPSPAEVPEGRIAFSRGYNIFTLDADGSDLTQMTRGEYYHENPTWSPDGSSIAYGSSGRLEVVSSDGSNYRDGSSWQLLRVGDEYSPAWSPDGTKIAFLSGVGIDYHTEIWVAKADGSNGMTELSHMPGDVGGPAWSPDGTKIAFAYSSGIFVMDSDGSNVVQLTHSSGDGSPTWSPDGTKIAFASSRDDPNFDIYVMNSDGSAVRRLTSNSASDWTPAWSPDGRWIAFVSNRDGNYAIYLAAPDGSVVLRLTQGTDDVLTYWSDRSPAWSPVG